MMAKSKSARTDHRATSGAREAFAELRTRHEELLRHVSHDLRTPLVAILLQAQILERSLDDTDPNKRRASSIVAMTREFTAAIERLVQTARLEAGIATCELQPIALAELVRDVVIRAFSAESRRVIVSVESDLPDVVADRRHIETLVRVLIARALAASTSAVNLALRRAGPELHLAVNDQGPSVVTTAESPILARGRIVDPLHVVRLISDLHGGRLWSDSAPGQGNTITVALPLRQGRRSAGGSRRRPPSI
jgi:signal transduction histidine kinase